MLRSYLLVITLFSAFAGIYSVCPGVSLPGDSACEKIVLDKTVRQGERILFDNYAYVDGPQWKLQNVGCYVVMIG